MSAPVRSLRIRIRSFLFCIGAAATSAAGADGVPSAAAASADQRAFAAEVARDGGPSEASVLTTLAGAKVQQSILDAISRPAEATKAWKDYRPIFVTDKRVADGIVFFRGNRALLERIGTEYGVPPEFIVAILGVETGYGKITGKYRVLDALSTLAFDYPPRAAFFRGELKQLFLLKDKQLAYPIDQLRGSYAGAMGWGQFMPTSIERWARDEDGDGRIDLWNSLPDITASVANYFADHGWEKGGPVAVRAQVASDAREIVPGSVEPTHTLQQMEAWGYAPIERVDAGTPSALLRLEGANGAETWLTFKNFYVITRYNKSPLYSMAVFQLAGEIADGASKPSP